MTLFQIIFTKTIITRLAFLLLTILLTVLSSPPDIAPAAAPLHPAAMVGTRHAIPQPNLSGMWVGQLLQNEGGIAPEFYFSMEIAQNGIFVRGKSYVKHEGIWAEMAFSGHVDQNGSLILTETEILRSQKPNDLSWCMKEYKLRLSYTPEGMVLVGPWWGDSIYGPCIPGSVRLKRRVKSV